MVEALIRLKAHICSNSSDVDDDKSEFLVKEFEPAEYRNQDGDLHHNGKL